MQPSFDEIYAEFLNLKRNGLPDGEVIEALVTEFQLNNTSCEYLMDSCYTRFYAGDN